MYRPGQGQWISNPYILNSPSGEWTIHAYTRLFFKIIISFCRWAVGSGLSMYVALLKLDLILSLIGWLRYHWYYNHLIKHKDMIITPICKFFFFYPKWFRCVSTKLTTILVRRLIDLRVRKRRLWTTVIWKFTSKLIKVANKLNSKLSDFRRAAESHRQTRKYVRSWIKPGMKLFDIW